jgi:hypothetical protein
VLNRPRSLPERGGLSVRPVLVELELRRCAGGSDRGWLGWQADVGEDLVHRRIVCDEGDKQAATAAVGADLQILFENPFDQVGPLYLGIFLTGRYRLGRLSQRVAVRPTGPVIRYPDAMPFATATQPPVITPQARLA